MEPNAPRFEKEQGVGESASMDHRHEMRLMARRHGLDEAQLRGLRDVTPAWSTATGAPLNGVPASVPPERPALAGFTRSRKTW